MSDGLSERIQRLEDEREITRQLYAYGQCIDYGAKDAFVAIFTADAVLTYSWDTANTVVDSGRAAPLRYEGTEAIREFVLGHTSAPDVYHKHMLMEPTVEVDGDRATALSYFSRFDRSRNGPLVSSFGCYRDLFVRCPDGRWRIRERRAEVEARVPADQTSVL